MLILQGIVAGALVAASALYVAWRLLTPRARARLLGGIARLPGGSGSWLARRLRSAALQKAGGCGSCGAGPISSRPAARTRTPVAPRR